MGLKFEEAKSGFEKTGYGGDLLISRSAFAKAIAAIAQENAIALYFFC